MLRVLPVQELKEEHVARDALGLQAQVLHLQLGHLGVDKNGKLAQPAGPGEARSAWPVPRLPGPTLRTSQVLIQGRRGQLPL